ncbi:MAG: outer membrane lipoprotein-sorting protein, partial [Desulfobulbus sp.]
RIPTTSQDDSFFGSDFSYDDFGGPPNLDDYAFTILREEIQDSRPCYVVEVRPRIHRKWSRYEAWVDKELFVHRKIIFFQDKEPYRAGIFTDIRMIDAIPTAFRMEMKNLRTAHRTEVVLEDILYHTNHPDDLFTQRSLERAGR